MMKIRVIATTLVAVILIPILSVAGDVVFIGNPSIPVSELSKHDIKSIFLGSKINCLIVNFSCENFGFVKNKDLTLEHSHRDLSF